ncbi:MAG: hypothetical protein JXJ04_17985 [Spirochaetales bacterium]|nr:hypothetical protein [Spirochaetales bacterium]
MAVDGKTVFFREKSNDTSYIKLENRLKALKNIAIERGWSEARIPKGILKESEGTLGYKVIYSTEDKIKTRTFWLEKDKESFISTLQKKNTPYKEDLLYHCRPYLNKQSPLPMAALKWTDAQLGEWLCWEWAAKKLGTNTPRKLSAVSFVAWKFNEAVITKLLGPGSLELAYWKETVRDRRTFQVLVSDLLSQVRNLMDSGPASADESSEREKTLKRIQKNWFVSYRQEYKNRFLTNLYMDFGKTGWVDPLFLQLIGQETLGWKEWETSVPQVITKAEELLDVVKGK